MKPIRHLRWYICGLLFLATTINYVDRQVLGLLKPMLERELNWSEADYGWIAFSFQTAYAMMLLLSGRAIDLIGTRTAGCRRIRSVCLESVHRVLVRR